VVFEKLVKFTEYVWFWYMYHIKSRKFDKAAFLEGGRRDSVLRLNQQKSISENGFFYLSDSTAVHVNARDLRKKYFRKCAWFDAKLSGFY
jgi:hypothetical protein